MTHTREFAVFYLALLCAVFTVLVYYPGYMSPDSVVQLSQARFGVTTNVYPPLMDYIWSVTDRILPGPGGMLILHNMIFWTALASIAYMVTDSQMVRLLFPIMGLWPPTFGMLGTIWKDVGMQAFLLATVAAVLAASYYRRLRFLLLAAVLLFIAAGYRHNALAAGVPLLILGVLEFSVLLPSAFPRPVAWLRERGLTRAFYFLSGIAVALVMSICLDFVNNYHLQDARLWSAAMVHDLTGISVQRNQDFLPPYINTGRLTVEQLKHMYSPLHANSLYSPPSRQFLAIPDPLPDVSISFQLSPDTARDLQLVWAQTVLDNFGSYMRHRLAIANKLLVLQPRQPWYPYCEGIDPNPFGLKFHPSGLNSRVMQVIRISAFQTPLYSAWFYYLILMTCLVVSFFWDFAYAWHVQLLVVSALIYLLSVFVFGMSGDFRYNIWALTCAFVCPVLLLSGRRKRSHMEPSRDRR